ncbi:High affinity cationic amino acid transporter 1 [Schistosoma japonicum]|uniref:High affinity cationic amino acid transporter 1 n=1 Tax=Schistosoma japonicum TaxID=6182 RepID=A0A4Z2D4A3_SCHJA|nr:High affinity cationic amino acid transporter 1 [Schistosoma japonicum]
MSDQDNDLYVNNKVDTTETKPLRKQQCCCQNYRDMISQGVFRKRNLKETLHTDLNRFFSTINLIFYGLACLLDGGIYMSTGTAMSTQTGPSTFLAYIIATIVALLNSLIYSELACYIPKDISYYAHTYSILGELPAFITAWSTVLDYILSLSLFARGWSNIVDIFTGNATSTWMMHTFGRLSSPNGILSEYPDLMSMLLILILAICCCFGLRKSVALTVITSGINVGILLLATIYMFVHAKSEHFAIISPAITTNTHYFLPYGILGLVKASTICFNAFIRSSVPSSRAQEVKRPVYSLPIANVTSILIVGLVTTVSAIALALYYPWFYVDAENAFLNALRYNQNSSGAKIGRIIIFCIAGSGFSIGLITSMISPMLACTNICLAMARDGFIPNAFSKVCVPFKRPFLTIIFIAIFSGSISTIFTVQSLAGFLSLGTLIACCINVLSVINVRYRCQTNNPQFLNKFEHVGGTYQNPNVQYYAQRIGKPGFVKEYIGFRLSDHMLKFVNSGLPGDLVVLIMAIYVILSCVLGLCLSFGGNDRIVSFMRIIAVTILIILLILCVVCISLIEQYKSTDSNAYRVPLVPLLPCLTLSLNLLLLSQLSWFSWVRYGIWMLFGLLIYFAYGIRNIHRISQENDSIVSSNCLSDIEYEKRSSKSNTSSDGSIEFIDPIRF